MDINKENNVEYKTKSKIPLPMQPLPSLPEKLLHRKDPRYPLKNVNYVTTCNKSSKVTEIDNSCPLRIDSRYITVRKAEDLDWDYKVFRDEKIFNSSVIDDAGPSRNDNKFIVKNNQIEDVTKNITPFKSPHLVNRIKNIKRSLKRPHSRELQGLSPIEKEYKAEGTFRRRLNFQEGVEGNLQEPDILNKTNWTCLARDYVMDVFPYLMEIEKKSPKPNIKSIPRACVVNWLMKISGTAGNPAVIQTALWYLDSYLAYSHIHIEFLQLVTAACYWISQKTYGPVITARRLVRCSSHAFTVGKLVFVEKNILATLKFPKTPVVAQDYIPYLCHSCDSACPGELEGGATFLCMSALMIDRTLCQEYPSVIAAAAVKNALLLLGQGKLWVKLQRNTVYKVAETKASNFGSVCATQRKAVCAVASPLCKYKAPLEQYGTAPHFIAQKIVKAARAHLSARNP